MSRLARAVGDGSAGIVRRSKPAMSADSSNCPFTSRSTLLPLLLLVVVELASSACW